MATGATGASERERQPATTSPGPPVSDDEFLADERYVLERFRPAVLDGWATRILDEGEGEPVFFVPIIKGLEVVYAKQLQEFAKTNRALIYERTESVDRPVYVEARVEELWRVLDHLGIERAHMVGLGDAGIPTFNFGRTHPDRCLSLTSICLGPRYRVPPYWLNERILNPLTERLPLERIMPDRLVRAMVVKATSGGRLPPHLVGHMVDQIPQQMRVHKFSVLPVTSRHEMRDWAHTLNVPTLLVNRDDDPLAPVAETRELAAALPNCLGVEILPGRRALRHLQLGRRDQPAAARLLREGRLMSRRLDGGSQGAEAPALPALERGLIGQPKVDQ